MQFEVWTIPEHRTILVTDRPSLPVGGVSCQYFSTWEKAVDGANEIKKKYFPSYALDYDNDAGREIQNEIEKELF